MIKRCERDSVVTLKMKNPHNGVPSGLRPHQRTAPGVTVVSAALCSGVGWGHNWEIIIFELDDNSTSDFSKRGFLFVTDVC